MSAAPLTALARRRARPRPARSAAGRAWQLAPHVLFITAALVIWQDVLGRFFSEDVVSSPAAVGQQIVDWAQDGTIVANLSYTMTALVIGFAIGTALALATAIVMSESKLLGRFLEPYIMATSAIPYTALAPILILWFGLGMAPKIVSGAMAAYFMVVVNAHTGLRDTDPYLLDLARILKASRLSRLWKIKIPASLPFVLVGLRLAVPRALIAVAVAEFLASSQGMGYLIVRSSNLLNTAGVLAATILLTALVYGLTKLMLLVERRVLRWRPEAST